MAAKTLIPSELNRKAEELIQIIKTVFIRDDGLLARDYPDRQRTLFDNFDDLVPFFIFFGETEFLLSQIRIIRNNRESMLSLCSEKDRFLVTKNIDEWFGGLYSLWKATGDDLTYQLLKESVEFVLDNLMKDGFLSAAFYLESNTAASCYECWSAGLLETFCEMRAEFPRGFEAAQQVLQNWIQNEYFTTYGLFPYRVYSAPLKRFLQTRFAMRYFPRKRHSKPHEIDLISGRPRDILKDLRTFFSYYGGNNGLYSQLMKSNSTCAFSLLEFFRATNDPVWIESLIKWIQSALTYFYDCGRVYMEVLPKTGARRDVSVSGAFILVDVLCDTLYFARPAVSEYRDHFMTVIKDILDYSWTTRLKSGLLPSQEGGKSAHIDTQVDFAVSLRRYAELSGDNHYKQQSIELVERVIDVHYSPNGYFSYSGEIAENVIDPKYNALLLKGFVHLLTIDAPIYPENYSLFKDR